MSAHKRKPKPIVPLDTDCDHGPVTNPCSVRLTVRICQQCARALVDGKAHVRLITVSGEEHHR